MSTLTPEQRRNLRVSLLEARRFGATPRERKALVEAESVESNFRNLNYGDRDSLGILQQRPKMGWNHATNVRLAVRDFLTHARANRGVKGSAGVLAQSVQQSAYPGRYDAQGSLAEQLLGSRGGGTSSSVGSLASSPSILAHTTVRNVKETIPDPEAEKRVALAQHLMQTNPNSILLRLGVVSPDEPVTQTITRQVKSGPLMVGQKGNTSPADTDSTSADIIERLVKRADAIDARKLPYLWGGGHGKKVNAFKATPLDCSGAVSAVLGVNPRVSGQFEKWGSPGQGKRVTVYSNAKHVLMEIDGHFFGTSGSNPGGGAGWIPRQHISPEYLKNFTARHPAGM